jgi:hypothetical protein
VKSHKRVVKCIEVHSNSKAFRPLWPKTVIHAANIQNLWIRKMPDGTRSCPAERWLGRNVDGVRRLMFTYGSFMTGLYPKDKVVGSETKKSFYGIYCGLAMTHDNMIQQKAICCYSLDDNKFIVTRSIHVDETIFPFQKANEFGRNISLSEMVLTTPLMRKASHDLAIANPEGRRVIHEEFVEPYEMEDNLIQSQMQQIAVEALDAGGVGELVEPIFYEREGGVVSDHESKHDETCPMTQSVMPPLEVVLEDSGVEDEVGFGQDDGLGEEDEGAEALVGDGLHEERLGAGNTESDRGIELGVEVPSTMRDGLQSESMLSGKRVRNLSASARYSAHIKSVTKGGKILPQSAPSNVFGVETDKDSIEGLGVGEYSRSSYWKSPARSGVRRENGAFFVGSVARKKMSRSSKTASHLPKVPRNYPELQGWSESDPDRLGFLNAMIDELQTYLIYLL